MGKVKAQAIEGELVKSDDTSNAKEKRVEAFYRQNSVILFKGQHLIRVGGKWEVMTRDLFERVFYSVFGGLSISTLNDTHNMVRAIAEPSDHLAKYIAMGDYVWDMAKCEFTQAISPLDCVFASEYQPDESYSELAKEFILQLANDRPEVADDIWQSLAPLITYTKPTGVVWYKGRGRNGKSGLLSGGDGVLARLFPGILANVTLKQIEDERDAPALNGRLANIVDESSDGVIEDSRTYKAIGTHQNFPVHKFHSQEQLIIDGNLHHIFSTNNMPVFNDKTDGARRRTIIIGFDKQFPLDELFYDRTFTPEFLSGFLYNLTVYAKELHKRRYVYAFSDITNEVKQEYDKIVNTAETFANWLLNDMSIAYFTNFTKIRQAYEWWCDNNSYSVLGKTHLRNAILECNFKRSSKRTADGSTQQIFLLKDASTEDTKEFMPGLFGRKDIVLEEKAKAAEQTEFNIW